MSVAVLLAAALLPMAHAAVPGGNTVVTIPAANAAAPASPAAGGGLPKGASVSVASPKVIGDVILELRDVDQPDTAVEADTCGTLARAAGKRRDGGSATGGLTSARRRRAIIVSLVGMRGREGRRPSAYPLIARHRAV